MESPIKLTEGSVGPNQLYNNIDTDQVRTYSVFSPCSSPCFTTQSMWVSDLRWGKDERRDTRLTTTSFTDLG